MLVAPGLCAPTPPCNGIAGVPRVPRSPSAHAAGEAWPGSPSDSAHASRLEVGTVPGELRPREGAGLLAGCVSRASDSTFQAQVGSYTPLGWCQLCYGCSPMWDQERLGAETC